MKSVCGVPLQKAVFFIGLAELVITLLVTIANVAKYAQFVEIDGEECEGKDVCIGPIIKYCVFDAFFGVVCALLLIFGSKLRNRCLLILWIIITFCCSIKYLIVFCMNDWSSLEDWISISYLAFYLAVFLVVISFMCETSGSDGAVHVPVSYKA